MIRLLLLFAIFGVGCSAPTSGDDRAAWLQNTLIEDNRPLLVREPELTAGKLRKMALNPYFYFRGTSAQYWRDARGPGEWATPTRYGTALSADMLLVGDPHPENVGSYLPADGTATVDFNDFDGARRGPFHFDVRRLATGFWIAAATIDLDEDVRREIAEASVLGYVDQIGRDEPFRVGPSQGYGPVIDDLVRRAVRDGDIQEELLEYTELQDNVRTMFYGQVAAPAAEGLIGDEVTEVTDEDRRFVERIVERYWDTVLDAPIAASRRVLGVSRRLGAGVSSYPLLRWYVLVDGETTDPADDVLLEVKEIVDPPTLDVARRPQVQHNASAERVVALQRAMQVTDRNDPYLGWAADGRHAFRIRHRTKYQKNVDVARLGEKLGDDWNVDDLVLHAEVSGRLLAAAHRRGEGHGAAVVAGLVDDGFVGETAAFAVNYGRQVLDDYATFVELLDTTGPLLGFVDREER